MLSSSGQVRRANRFTAGLGLCLRIFLNCAMASLNRASATSQKRKRYMHIARSLFQNQAFSLLCFEHPPQPEDCGDGEETCSANAVNFVEAGSFELGVQNQRWKIAARNHGESRTRRRPSLRDRKRSRVGLRNDFQDYEVHQLKGIPGEWRLLAARS